MFDVKNTVFMGGLILIACFLNAAAASDELGNSWRHSYQRELIVKPYGSGTSPIYYIDSAGRYWKVHGSGVQPHRILEKEGATLTWDSTHKTWTLRDGSTQEIFSRDGRLEKIIKGGRETILHYNSESGLLTTVVGYTGRQLRFEYEAGLLTAVIRPDGERITYQYEQTAPPLNSDEPGYRLGRVTYPDGTSRQYHYERSDFQHHLTGITDENGDRFSTFHYDSAGQVVGSEHAGGVEKVHIDRRADGSIVVTDPLGHDSTYRYTTIGNMRKFSGVEGGPCATCSNTDAAATYDVQGFVKTRTGFDGVVTEYQRDGMGRELSRTEAVGTQHQRTIHTQWNTVLNLPTHITEPGRITEYTYDSDGNRLSQTVIDITTGEARTMTWTYNSLGLVETVDGPRTDVNDIATYTYDVQGNLETATNALGHVMQYTQYDVHGNPLEIIDPNGVVTELEYDLRQRLIRRTIAAGATAAATTAFAYDPAGQLIRTTLPNGAWVAYEYDAAHRMTAIDDSAGNRIDYMLDAMGNRIHEMVSGPAGDVFRETSREYSTLNRLMASIGGEGQRTTYEYDADGNRIGITDAAYNSTTNRYDALDRLFETVDALGGVTRYDYDPRDNLTEVIDPRGVTTNYIYNGFDELLETRSPDAGTTTYTYDAAGNRTSQTDARGITTYFEYDALNRLTLIDYPGYEKDITYTYDEDSYGKGRLTSVTDESGITEYQYNPRGELISKQTVVQGQALNVAYEYDTAGNVTAMTYPDGQRVTYERDTLGRVSGISVTGSDGAVRDIVNNVSYQPFGPVNGLVYANGLTESRNFDNDGRIAAITVPGILERSYSWDSTNNITGITNHLDSAKSQGFDYDALYCLTWANGNYGDITYDYDAVGNRTAKSVIPLETGIQETSSFTYAMDSNRLISVEDANGFISYQYDDAGNTLSDGAAEYSYDVRNRFTAASPTGDASSFDYVHNALGQRVVKPRFQTAVPGDASGDGVIDQNDLLSLHDMIKGRIPASAAADCNQDGSVDNKDVSCIANQIGGTKSNGQENEKDKKAGSSTGAPFTARSSASDRAISTYAASATGDVGEIVGHTLFAYDEAGHLIGEYDEAGNVIRQYIWLNDRPIAMLANGQVYYIHTDHLNTPQVVTDTAQQVVWQGRYTPFGEVETTVSSVDMPLRFPGQYYDAETGLNYNYFRSYDASTGRYTQSDPIGLDGGLNTYAYVLANPVNIYDSTGLVGWRCNCKASDTGGVNVPGVAGKRCSYTCQCSCDDSLFPFIKDEVTVRTITRRHSKMAWDKGSLICHGQSYDKSSSMPVFNEFYLHDGSPDEYGDIRDAVDQSLDCGDCQE